MVKRSFFFFPKESLMIDWKDYWEVIMCSNLNFLKFLDPIPRCVWGGSYFLTTVCLLSHFSLYTSLWNSVGLQAPLSKGFSRQEHWSGLPFPSLGDIPDPGIKPASLYVSCIVRQVFFFFNTRATWEFLTQNQKNSWTPEGHHALSRHLQVFSQHL